MSDSAESIERVVRSFNFDKVIVSRTRRGVEARSQDRMHRFSTGMQDHGRARRVLDPLNERQAHLLYEALEELLGKGQRTPEQARIRKLEERMMDMVDVRDLRAFIKCQRCPWISRTEDEYQMRQMFADELEEVLEKR